MSENRVRVMKEVEQREITSGGQKRIVRTMVTSSSSGSECFSSKDMLSHFSGMNLSDKVSGQSSSRVTRTVKYVTNEGTVTKSWSEKDSPSEISKSPSRTQKITNGTKLQPANETTPVEKASPVGTPKKSSASISSGGTDDFKDECLKKHNHYRAKHGVPLLTLSPKLCDYAQEWANHLAKSDTFQHRPNNKYGENIYMEWSSNPSGKVSGEKSVDSWYSEIKVHKFGREPTSLASGHFTQVIWKSSKELGVAYGRNKNGKTYVVANYDPAGNMIGSFSPNVPPPK